MPLLEVEEKGKEIIIHLRGEMNLTNLGNFELTIGEQIQKKPETIILDCEDLKHIDSSGIAALVKQIRSAISKKIDMYMINVSSELRKIFDTVKLTSFFKIK